MVGTNTVNMEWLEKINSLKADGHRHFVENGDALVLFLTNTNLTNDQKLKVIELIEDACSASK